MSKKEQDRSEVIGLYVEKAIKQKEAAKRLKVSTRQIRNEAHAYRLHDQWHSVSFERNSYFSLHHVTR